MKGNSNKYNKILIIYANDNYFHNNPCDDKGNIGNVDYKIVLG